MMSPERWARIAALFERACELSGDDRQSFLDGISEVDVRREVEALLEAGERSATSSSQTRLAARVRTRVGKYRLEEIVGGGGQGCVYRAVHEEIGLEVAVKALPPEFATNPTCQARLKREGQVLATLDHEHIARVHDIVSDGRELFLITEFIHGRNLRQELAAGPIPVPTALDYATQVLGALAAAHAKGIVHRDLKPENVMITTAGRVKLLDFGLARLMPHGSDPTRLLDSLSSAVVGTVAYMSPEQLRSPEVDARSDVFSFGVLLYEMLCGAHPFGDPASWSIVGHIERDRPVPLESRRHSLPEGLSAVVERCLQKRPEDRYRSAGEIADALGDTRRTGAGTSDAVRWWQFHQGAASGAYAAMLYPFWLALEVVPWRRFGLVLFFVGLGAAVTAVTLRLFLRFSWSHYRDVFDEEWNWVGPVLFLCDVLYVGLLILAATAVVFLGGPPIGVAILLFIVALACAVGFLRIEPAAARAAFGETHHQPSRLPNRFGSGRLGA